MNRMGVSGSILTAVLAVGALVPAAAIAENPEIIPTPSAEKPAKFSVEGTNPPTLQGTHEKNLVRCNKAKGTGAFTTVRTGTISIAFEECGSNGAKCSTAGDAAGVILTVESPTTLVDVLPTATLDLGVWIEPLTSGKAGIKFKCGVIGVEVLGADIGVGANAKGELLTSGTKGKEFKALRKEEEKEGKPVLGEQEVKACDFPKAFCEGKTFGLTTSFGAGEELSGLISNLTIVFSQEVELRF